MGRWRRPWQRGLWKETERGERKNKTKTLSAHIHTRRTHARGRGKTGSTREGAPRRRFIPSSSLRVPLPVGRAPFFSASAGETPPPLKSSSKEKHSPFLLLTFLPGWLNQVTTFLAHHLWKCPFGTTLLWRTMALLSLSRSSRSLSGRSRPLAWCSYDRHSSPAKLTFFKQLLRSIAAIGKQWGSAGHINNKGFLLWGAFSGAFLGGGGEIVSRRKCFGERRSSRKRRENTKVDFPC